MKRYRLFVRDAGRKYTGFKDVMASDARAAERRFVVPDWVANPAGYYKAIEWAGGHKGYPATPAGERWLAKNLPPIPRE